MNQNQFYPDKYETLDKIISPPLKSMEIIHKELQSPNEIRIPDEYLPTMPSKSFDLEDLSGFALDAAFGVDTHTRRRFGMPMALFELYHPLDALGAKIVAIGQQHLDRVDRELAAIRAE